MKKQNISRLDLQAPNIDPSVFESKSDLPTKAVADEFVERLTMTPEKIEKAVAMVMREKKKPKVSDTDIERGRDAKGELNRVGITALIDRNTLKDVKIFAIKKGVSMSDVINDALNKYLSN